MMRGYFNRMMCARPLESPVTVSADIIVIAQQKFEVKDIARIFSVDPEMLRSPKIER